MSNGPVCHIPPANTPADPQPQNMPGVPAPVSPPKTGNTPQDNFNRDLANAINAIIKILSALRNTGGGNNVTNNFTSKQSSSSYQEVNRQTKKVRVFQNNDKTSSNWVDVEQINGLTFKNPTTKETLSWTRGGSSSD